MFNWFDIEESIIRKSFDIKEGVRQYIFDRRQELMADSLYGGDVIFVNRGFYCHFGIYAGDNEVIHFADPSSTSLDPKKAVVHSTTMKKFLNGSKKLYFCKFREFYSKPLIYLDEDASGGNIYWGKLYKFQDWTNVLVPLPLPNKKYKLCSADETIKNARKMIGNKKYHLIRNNCEHFAIYCKTGIKESHQVKRIVGFIIGIFGFKLPPIGVLGASPMMSTDMS